MSDFGIGVLLALCLVQVCIIGWHFKRIFIIANKEKQLIEAYRNYIHFLESYIDRKESYLRVHQMGATQEEFEEGERLRRVIFRSWRK